MIESSHCHILQNPKSHSNSKQLMETHSWNNQIVTKKCICKWSKHKSKAGGSNFKTVREKSLPNLQQTYLANSGSVRAIVGLLKK